MDRVTEAGRRSPAVQDRGRLLAEVDRLRAENTRLGQIVDELTADNAGLTASLDAVHKLVQEAVDRMEPVSWIDALRAALGETGGTDER
jgi:hypothetical protein